MNEHERTVTKVADWLADGWDWDSIAAALGVSPEAAYDRYGADAAEQVRRMEGREPGDEI
jgi:hypothetical protein